MSHVLYHFQPRVSVRSWSEADPLCQLITCFKSLSPAFLDMMMMIEDDTNLRFVINITALPEKNITEGSLPDLLSLLVTMISMDVELTENNSNTTTQQHNIQHHVMSSVPRPSP